MSEMNTVEVRYLNYEQATTYSGLSEASLRRLIVAGRLRASKPTPNRVLIDRQELDRYLAECSAAASA